MIVDKSTINPEETIDLDGPNGNALYLIGYIHKVFSFKPELRDQIIEEMKSSDYYNLLQTFEYYVGHYVTLLSSDKKVLKTLSYNSMARFKQFKVSV